MQPGLSRRHLHHHFANWPYVARIMRGQVLSLREKEFVEASRSLGASNWRIIFREILPNLVAPIIVYATLFIPTNILFEAALSFLGVGVQPPSPRWGKMLADATEIFDTAWWYMLFPGIALLLTVLAFNLARRRPAGRAQPEGAAVVSRTRLLHPPCNRRKDAPCVGPWGHVSAAVCRGLALAWPRAAATTRGAGEQERRSCQARRRRARRAARSPSLCGRRRRLHRPRPGVLLSRATWSRRRPSARRCWQPVDDATKTEPDLAESPPEVSERRQDPDGEDQAGHQVLPARESRGHVQGRQVRDRARFLQRPSTTATPASTTATSWARRSARSRASRDPGHPDADDSTVVFKLNPKAGGSAPVARWRVVVLPLSARCRRSTPRSSTRRSRRPTASTRSPPGLHDPEQRLRQGDRLPVGQADPPRAQPELVAGHRLHAPPTSTRSRSSRATTTPRSWAARSCPAEHGERRLRRRRPR